MILGLLQLSAFLGTAWCIGHLVDLSFGRSEPPHPPEDPPPAPPVSPRPRTAAHETLVADQGVDRPSPGDRERAVVASRS